MVDAGGTNTLIQLSNEGPYMKFILHNTSVDSTETIPFDGPSNSPVVAEDRVMILGAQNWTDEISLNSDTHVVEYDETNMHFTVTDAAMTNGSSYSIVFIYIPQGDSSLGSA